MKPSEEKRWLDKYPEQWRNSNYSHHTLYMYLKLCNENNYNSTAIDYYGSKYTFKEMIDQIDYFADCYASWGIKKGDMILFLNVSVPETVFSLYALNKIGAIPVFIEPRMSKSRIEHFINITKVKTMVILDLVYPKIEDLISKYELNTVFVQNAYSSLPLFKSIYKTLTTKKPKITYNSVVKHFDDLLVKFPSTKAVEAPYEEGRVAVITQTGGTTGIPKGVMLTDDSLNSVAHSVKCSYIGVKPGDKFLNIMPIFTSYGISNGIITAFSYGATSILIPDFKPERFPGLMKKYNPHSVIGVPTFFESLTSSKKLKNAEFDNLIFPVTGGDYMNLALERKMDEFFKQHGSKSRILQGYGLSETSAATSFSFNGYVKEESVGVPLLNSTIGIFNPETLEELDYNQTGEICISGPSIMKGYFKNEEETNKVMKLHPDGKLWIHSGDLGYLDEDGYLFFSGRVKFVIPRFDGHKNYPSQIEKVALMHPGIINCSVIGCKDREHSHGMYPLIIAELADKNSNQQKIRSEVLDICKKNLEDRGQPCGVVFVEKIPLTLVGKNDVVSLTKEYENFDYTQNN